MTEHQLPCTHVRPSASGSLGVQNFELRFSFLVRTTSRARKSKLKLSDYEPFELRTKY